MLDKLKSLGTDTATYGISTIVGRFLTFILTPFYTHILSEAELGIVATVYAFIAFLNILYGYGMEAAFMRYTASLEIGTKKQNFSVPFLSMLVTSFVFTGIIMWQRELLASMSSVPMEHNVIIVYGGLVLLFDALAIIPFASLRMDRKARVFSILKLFNIIVTVGLTLWFLFKLGMGIEGIFLGNLIASVATFLLLVPMIVRNLEPSWNERLCGALLRFGLPAIPAYIAAIMIQVIDRPILLSLTNEATVGVYQANYRLGIFMMLLVSMFDFAWRPFFLTTAKEPDAKPLFARVLTYFVLVASGCFLAIALFIGDLVTSPIVFGKTIIAPAFWGGLSIVPVVLLAYVFLGVSNILGAGIYIEKKTERLPIITFAGAAVNVAANFLLIPVYGIMGAAIATLLSYAVMACVLYVIVQKIYPIDYELGRLAKIVAGATVVYTLFAFVPVSSFGFLWKLGLLCLFVLLMYVLKFFNTSELSALLRVVGSRAGRPEKKSS